MSLFPSAFLAMAAILAVDGALPYDDEKRRTAHRLPVFAIVTTVIVLRTQPGLVVAAALIAAPWVGWLRRSTLRGAGELTAIWVTAALVGWLGFRLVGQQDRVHWIIATVVLAGVTGGVDVGLGAIAAMRAGRPAIVGARGEVRNAAWTVVRMGAIAPFYAITWRTPGWTSYALKTGELAVLGVVGLSAGHLIGGDVCNIFRSRLWQRSWFVIVAVALILLSPLAPAGLQWVIAAIGLLSAAIWAVRHRVPAAICGALGGICNMAVVGANGGTMPVDPLALQRLLGQPAYERLADSYLQVSPDTRLPWLADRFLIPPPLPFQGVISVGDLLLAVGMIWLVAGLMRAPAAQIGETAQPERLPAAA